MITVTNTEFLQALFGVDAPWVHVTDFTYDPGAIPEGRHLNAWKGDYFSRYNMQQGTNQYFTISNFFADKDVARRRKALFRHTPVIVLDDVKEKLNMSEVEKLPAPSWILESSQGSEQWGYILDTPCTDRLRVENLLDGLVANGLAPEGRDPGMKGVTRYVRLPEGYNTKQKKLVNGQPFKCQITLWEPTRRVTLEQLAAPFHVNLDMQRRESRVDGAASVDDHPLININDIIHIKEDRENGRFDITCPWVDEHTGAEDNGAGIFTNKDNSIGFKCHHGACQHRTGKDLLNYIESRQPGFGLEFSNWKFVKAMTDVITPQPVSFLDQPVQVQPVTASFLDQPVQAPVAPVQQIAPSNGLDDAINQLHVTPFTMPEARRISTELLKVVEELPAIDQVHYQTTIREHMRWSKSEFTSILKDLRTQWYDASKATLDFFSDVIFIAEQNQFFDRRKNIFYSADAYQNTYSHLDADARKEALQGGMVSKVDRIDYAPKMPAIFEERGITYGNSWCDVESPQGTTGDVSPWLNHFDALGWGDYKDHVVKWMAYTIQFPEHKINHMLILGSGEGCGKDWLLTPLTNAMVGHERTIQGEELLEKHNDYLMSVKYLNINETELGDRREAVAVSNKLKPLATAPPLKLRVNPKGVKAVDIRNIVNCTMTTNSQQPIRLNGASRRFFALWTDVNPRDDQDVMTPEWKAYWNACWDWMKNGGSDAVIYYLRNCVDLSNFNPSEAPPVTDFLREIRESSKSPAEQTIESFIRAKQGAFMSDLMTSQEISDTLRMGSLIAPGLMYTEERIFTPQMCGRILKQMTSTVQMRGQSQHNTARIWILRNRTKYAAMSPSEIYLQYELQMKQARTNVGIKPVTQSVQVV